MDAQITHKAFLILFIILFSLLRVALLVASPIDPDEYNGPSPGARSLGLGNAAIALKNDPFSSFYNPAALCFVQNSVVVFDFNYGKGSAREFDLPNVGGVAIDFIGMLNQAGGLTWHPLTRRTTEAETTYYDPNYGDTIQVNARYEYRADEVYSTMTTLATENFETLLRKPLLGVNLKYFRAQCAEANVIRMRGAIVDATSNIDSGNGFGIDVGFSYATEMLLFGLSVKDAFSRVYWRDYDTDKIHAKVGTGISYLIAERATLSTDIRYDWGKKTTGSFSGIEVNLLKKMERKTKHMPIGETESNEVSVRGNIVRAGAQIRDFSNSKEIIYTLGYSYLYTRFRFDIAFMGEQQQIKEGDFSSQVSLLILY
jgi:hypothetical protein